MKYTSAGDAGIMSNCLFTLPADVMRYERRPDTGQSHYGRSGLEKPSPCLEEQLHQLTKLRWIKGRESDQMAGKQGML